jgi:hypothetical protein
MSTDQLVVTALALLLLEQSFQGAQQFLRRGSLIRDEKSILASFSRCSTSGRPRQRSSKTAILSHG